MGERLAILELVIPTVFLLMSIRESALSALRKFSALLLLVGSSVVAFSLSESNRSWRAHSAQFESIHQYGIDRLWAYYATAVNNGVIYDETIPFRGLPFSLQFAHNNPLGSFFGLSPSERSWSWVLKRYAGSDELNNVSGYFVVSADLGWIWGCCVFVILGLVTGFLWKRAKRGNLTSIVAYAVWILPIVELPRLFYFGLGRAVIMYIGIIVVWIVVRQPAEPRVPTSGQRKALTAE